MKRVSGTEYEHQIVIDLIQTRIFVQSKSSHKLGEEGWGIQVVNSDKWEMDM
jgi:hypothetical protein